MTPMIGVAAPMRPCSPTASVAPMLRREGHDPPRHRSRSCGTFALASSPAAGKSRERTLTIKARSQIDQVQLVDNAPAGDSPGDLLMFTEKLLDSRGKRIGSDAASCVRMFDATSLCTGTYTLPGGA